MKTAKFAMVVHQAAEGGYWAAIPELPVASLKARHWTSCGATLRRPSSATWRRWPTGANPPRKRVFLSKQSKPN